MSGSTNMNHSLTVCLFFNAILSYDHRKDPGFINMKVRDSQNVRDDVSSTPGSMSFIPCVAES